MAKPNKKVHQQTISSTQGITDELNRVYHAIFELSPDAIAIHDGKVLRQVNPAGVKMLGAQNAEEVIGKPIIELIHPKDPDMISARFERLRQGQSVPLIEEQLIRLDGSTLDVEIAATPYQYHGEPASLIFVRDITQRKQADEALRQSEAALRQAQHFAHVGSWTWDAKTNQLEWSDEMYVIFEVDKATFSGSLADVITQTTHPDDLPRVQAKKLALLQGKDLTSLEYRIIWKDNSVHYILSEPGEIILDDDGKPIFMRGTTQEITERKQAELSLQKSENRLHQAAQLAGLGIWEWDMTTDQVEWSGEMFRIYGVVPEQFTGKGTDYLNYIRADYREAQHNYIMEAFKRGITETDLAIIGNEAKLPPRELCIVRPDGSECYILGDAIAIVDESGKPLRMMGVIQDITERKKAELLVRKSESRLNQAAQLAGLGIWDWDATTDRVEWSGDMFRIYGIDPETFTGNGSDYFEFTHADYREAQQKNVTEAFNHGITEAQLMKGKGVKLNPKELCIVRPDGTECYTLGDAVCIVDENGKPLRMLGVTLDITERRATEIKLRESEERFRSLSLASFEGLAIHDNGIIQDANQAFANFFGHEKPEDLIGRHGLETLSFSQESIEQMKMNMRTGSTEPLEITIFRPDGTAFQAETQGRYFNFKGRSLRVVAMRDITRRKQAEETQARLTAILEATPDYVSIADPNQQITYLNRAGRKMIGIGENEDISNLKIGDLNPEWATETIKTGVEYAIQHGVWSGESARRTRDGREFPVAQVIIAHKTSDGTVEYLSTICRDITESKQAEEKIRRQLDHLTALSEIDRAITSSFDLSQSLKTLLSHVTRQLDVDAADALLFDGNSNSLQYIAGTGFRSQSMEDFSMSLGAGHASRVILERRMVEAPNLLENPEHFVRANLLADDQFTSYFGVPLIAKDKVEGVLEVFHRTHLQPDEEWVNFFHALAEQAAIAIDNALLFSDLHNSKLKLEQAYDTTLDGWSKALDLRDKETEGHTRRVTELTLQVARKMGFTEEALVQIKRGGLLHDIGKMGIPDAILLKPGILTDDEWAIMRKHTTYAYEMLSPIEYLQPALDIPYCHHERWDGTGYPRGLQGDEIPLVARIFSVADVWDALRSDRPYRKAWEKDRVLDYIRSLAGKQFDPKVVDVFMELIHENET